MTRYEMAQIVAKALAKGAIGADDKLVGEFADELDNLGVRVAKLEKHADNFKITAQVRYSYQDITGRGNAKYHDVEHFLRSRLYFTGDVNDNWQYVGMLQNNHSFSNDMSVGGHNQETTAGEGTNFQRAYLQGRLGGARVQAGRIDFNLVNSNLYDNRFDGIKAEYGSKVRIGGYYGRPTDIVNLNTANVTDFDYDKFWGVNAAADAGNFNFTAGYDRFYAAVDSSTSQKEADGLWNVGAKYNFNDKASLGAIFMKSSLTAPADNTNKAYVITGTFMEAKPAKVGSWGLWAKYYNQGYGTALAHVMNGMYSDRGFKGWGAGVNYTVAKNMVAGFEYYDLDYKGEDAGAKTLWSELTMMF